MSLNEYEKKVSYKEEFKHQKNVFKVLFTIITVYLHSCYIY